MTVRSRDIVRTSPRTQVTGGKVMGTETIVTGLCSGRERERSPPNTAWANGNLQPRSHWGLVGRKLQEQKGDILGKVTQQDPAEGVQGDWTSPGGKGRMRNPIQ